MPVNPKAKSAASKVLSRAKEAEKEKRLKGPKWKGPEEDGITFSMLSRYLVCQERFRIEYLEGMRPHRTFNKTIEYGQMWHECEEAHAKGVDWKEPLRDYCNKLSMKHRTQQEEISRWFNICCQQFPRYIKYWEKHPDIEAREPCLEEQVFRIPYTLPSGRIVYLKGKWDSVDLVMDGPNKGIWLQENKTKGKIDQEQLQRQLTCDLQSMMYLVALMRYNGAKKFGAILDNPIKGVRYNVVLRPLAGGKNTIVQRKGRLVNRKGPDKKPLLGQDGKPIKHRVGVESDRDFYKRLGQLIEDESGFFFMRWNVEVSKRDIQDFRLKVLDPLLEELCLWYYWVSECYVNNREPFSPLHKLTPFGFYNSLAEGRSTDLDDYILTGNSSTLDRDYELFPELKE